MLAKSAKRETGRRGKQWPPCPSEIPLPPSNINTPTQIHMRNTCALSSFGGSVRTPKSDYVIAVRPPIRERELSPLPAWDYLVILLRL